MCLAIPGKLISMDEEIDAAFRTGVVSFDGVTRKVNLSMVPEAQTGDHILVHVGVAISKVDEAEAGKIMDVLRQSGELESELGPNDNV